MNNYVEKVENLSLLVNGDKPRLLAVFPQKANEIINSVESEIKGAHALITSHYFSLPFESKPETYWTEKNMKYEQLFFTKFQFDYMAWSIMVGIRNLPDQIVLGDVLECLKESFGIHNEESIKTAIKMNLQGQFDEVVEPFGQVNRVYITKIMTAYEKKLLVAHKRAIQLRDKDKGVEHTPEQKEQKFRDAVVESFNIFKQFGEESILTFNMYDLLDRLGKINFTKAEKDQFMYRAKARLQDINDKPGNRIAITPLDFSNGDTKLKLVNIAKVMAVAEYFRTIETLEL